jgi:hypothetical protein
VWLQTHTHSAIPKTFDLPALDSSREREALPLYAKGLVLQISKIRLQYRRSCMPSVMFAMQVLS